MKIPIPEEQKPILNQYKIKLRTIERFLKITPFKSVITYLQTKHENIIQKRDHILREIIEDKYESFRDKNAKVFINDNFITVREVDEIKTSKRKKKVPGWKWHQVYNEWFLQGKPIHTIAVDLNVSQKTVYAAFKERNLPYKNIK